MPRRLPGCCRHPPRRGAPTRVDVRMQGPRPLCRPARLDCPICRILAGDVTSPSPSLLTVRRGAAERRGGKKVGSRHSGSSCGRRCSPSLLPSSSPNSWLGGGALLLPHQPSLSLRKGGPQAESVHLADAETAQRRASLRPVTRGQWQAGLPSPPPPTPCLSGTGEPQSPSRAQGPTARSSEPRQSPGPGAGGPSVPGRSQGLAGKRPEWASGSGRGMQGLPAPGTGALTRRGDMGFQWRVSASCTDSLLSGQELAGEGRAPVPRERVPLALWVPFNGTGCGLVADGRGVGLPLSPGQLAQLHREVPDGGGPIAARDPLEPQAACGHFCLGHQEFPGGRRPLCNPKRTDQGRVRGLQ